MAGFGQEDLVRLLVDGEVARLDHALAGARVGLADLLLQLGHDGVDAHVQLGVVLGLALMISGVRASSIRIESTSSTMAKFRPRCTRSAVSCTMLSRR